MSKFILCFTLILLYSSCHHTQHHDEEYSLAVTKPEIMDTTIDKEYVCQIRAINHIELRSLERGYIQKIFVDEGQSISKGQPMFQIMPALLKSEMDISNAEVNYADIEYKNTQMLSDKNIVSKQELALSKAKLDKEKADLNLKKSHLGLATVRAPFSGIMDKFQMRLGSLVEEGELLTSLSDISKLWVYFNVTEAEYLNYVTKFKKEGYPTLRLKMANGAIYDQPGKFETIEADFNNETGNIAFRASFPNPDRILRHGETGTILLPTRLTKAMFIPQEATFDILDKKFVFVVDNRDVVQMREITVGSEMEHLYVVTSGLSSNDKVLIDGLRKVKNGDKIKPIFKPFRQVMDALYHLESES